MAATARQGRKNWVLSWLPAVVMAVVTVVDLTAGPGVGFLPLVSLGPAFAGLIGTWRRTALIGLVALLLCGGLGSYDGLFETRRGYTAMASVAGVTLAGVIAASMRGRREAELASVRSIAEVAQRVLLRPVPRSAGPLQVAVSYTSAVAEARIGSDLYEVVASPHGVRVIVGDVQGKGLAAVETAALVLGTFRETAHDEPDLAALAARLERSVAREVNGEKFVTAVLVEVRAEERAALVLNCGHPAPMRVRADGSVDFPRPPVYSLPSASAYTGASPLAPTGSTSPPATNSCSTPTASPRPATGPAPFSRWRTGPTCSRPRRPRMPWRRCARTWCGTPTARCTTTPPCCCCATGNGEA